MQLLTIYLFSVRLKTRYCHLRVRILGLLLIHRKLTWFPKGMHVLLHLTFVFDLGNYKGLVTVGSLFTLLTSYKILHRTYAFILALCELCCEDDRAFLSKFVKTWGMGSVFRNSALVAFYCCSFLRHFFCLITYVADWNTPVVFQLFAQIKLCFGCRS